MMFTAWRYRFLVLVAGAALAPVLGGCSGAPTAPTATVATTTAATTAPTAMGAGAGGIAQASQTPTDVAAASQAPASSPPAAGQDPTVMPTTASATLYYIALGDAGTAGTAVGCGDSAVAVTSAAISFTDAVEGALRTLLADHSQFLGQSGLNNALWQSRLEVQSVARGPGSITAHLTGTLKTGGECDIPRVQQQLLLTARDAAGAPVAVTINEKTLSAVLSLK
ncbi:hypothetical protein B5P43_16930 [Bacillus sp. SRB_336]|nr:hypothetical protein B5P43_16930 [Bacillus sp. SRB_336]